MAWWWHLSKPAPCSRADWQARWFPAQSFAMFQTSPVTPHACPVQPVSECPRHWDSELPWQASAAEQLRRRIPARAVTARPFLADLSCKGPLAGSVAVNPGGMMSPPFMVRYNKVRA